MFGFFRNGPTNAVSKKTTGTGDVVCNSLPHIKATLLDPVTYVIGGGNVTIDADLADVYYTDITADVNFQNPTNRRDGRRFMLVMQTHAVLRNITWGGQFQFPNANASPLIDTTVAGWWFLGFWLNPVNNQWYNVGPLVGPL